MNRIDRLNALMIYLQSKSSVTMDQLEQKFGLTRRTLFRDVKALMEAGLPIGGDAGSGYFIVDGYHLPPVVFNKEEAAALLLGSKFVTFQADESIAASYDNALTKVKAVIRFSDKEQLDRLDEKIKVIPSPSTALHGFPDSHLQVLQTAIFTQKTVAFDYYSSYNDSYTHREVEPLGLVYYANRWHLMAFCQLRQDLRDFRTDRIQKATITNHDFNPEKHVGFEEFVNRTLMGTDALEAIIEVSHEGARIMTDQKYTYGFVFQEETDRGFKMKFSTPSYEYFCRWLLSYTNSIRLIGPAELKTTMSRLVDDLRQAHQ